MSSIIVYINVDDDDMEKDQQKEAPCWYCHYMDSATTLDKLADAACERIAKNTLP